MANEFEIVEENRKSNTLIKVLLTVILLATIIGGIFIFAFSSIVTDFFTKGTDPQAVLNETHGKFLMQDKSYQSFDEFYNSITEAQSSKAPQANDSGTPILEYTIDFYNYRPEYYDACEQKTVGLFFNDSKSSTLLFNYQDQTVQYNINLYHDLYTFTDNLKLQDCYFRGGSYTRGYYKDPYNDQFMKSVADDFNVLREKYTDDELVELAALFVQSIPYGTDKTNLNRYPYETFYEVEGNCLDKSVILTYLLDELGYTSYIILGQSTEYHALVGIVCDEGANIRVNDQPVCFIETTVFAPIGTPVDIDIDDTVDTSYGSKVYHGTSYGPQLVTEIEDKKFKTESITQELEIINNNLLLVERDMCTTDCVICEDNAVDFERSNAEISSCLDANLYNQLVQDYNDQVTTYNDKIKSWYQEYYDIERLMFENIELVER